MLEEIANNTYSLESTIVKYKSIIAKYCSNNYSSDKTEDLIENFYTLLKACCLLNGTTFGTDGNSLAVWESIVEKLPYDKDSIIKNQMLAKTVHVRAFITKVENIKSLNSSKQNKYDLEYFQKHLKDIKKYSDLIDFNTELLWADSLVKGIETRMRDIDEPSDGKGIMLHELQSHIEFFKRSA